METPLKAPDSFLQLSLTGRRRNKPIHGFFNGLPKEYGPIAQLVRAVDS